MHVRRGSSRCRVAVIERSAVHLTSVELELGCGACGGEQRWRRVEPVWGAVRVSAGLCGVSDHAGKR